MVIILIGIMSYGAVSMFSSRDKYAGFIAKDQLISSALLAQQIALGMSGESISVTLKVERAIDPEDSREKWIFTLKKENQNTKVIKQETAGGSLAIDGTIIALNGSQTFTWNREASLVDGANHSVTFVSGNTYRVCISASGYTYFSSSTCPS